MRSSSVGGFVPEVQQMREALADVLKNSSNEKKMQYNEILDPHNPYENDLNVILLMNQANCNDE